MYLDRPFPPIIPRCGRSGLCGRTHLPRTVRTRPISWRRTAAGARCPSRKPQQRSRSLPTACSLSASRRATPSESSPGPGSSGCSSTSPSLRSERSRRRSTRRAPRARPATSSSTRTSSAAWSRTTSSSPRSRPHAPSTSTRSRPSTSSARSAASTRRLTRTPWTRRARQIGDDDLFTFIYTSGTTGPPKACMILNRNYYEMVGTDRPDRELLPPERRPAPLPAARTQLRAAHAPAGRAPRLHDRVPARPAPHRRGDAGGEADRPPDRAARAGEGAHRGHRQLRGRNGRQAPADRLGARRGPAGEPAPPAARAGPEAAWRSNTGSQTGSSTRRSRSAWVGGSAPRSRGARRSRRRSPSSSTRWTSSSSRATARPRRRARRT